MRPKPKRRTNAFLSETLEMLLPNDSETSLAKDSDEEGDLTLESFSDEESWISSMPLYILMSINGNNEGDVVGVFLLENESTEEIDLMIHKDFSERNALKQQFPDVKRLVCLFHTLKAFRSAITMQAMQINFLQSDHVLNILQRIAYANSEEDYELEVLALRQLNCPLITKCFKENWHCIKEEWKKFKTFHKVELQTTEELYLVKDKDKSIFVDEQKCNKRIGGLQQELEEILQDLGKTRQVIRKTQHDMESEKDDAEYNKFFKSNTAPVCEVQTAKNEEDSLPPLIIEKTKAPSLKYGDGDFSVNARIKQKITYGQNISKIECANRMTRNAHQKLHKLATNKSFPLNARKLLTSGGVSRIGRLAKRTRTAIKRSSNKDNSLDSDVLHQDLLNAPYHVFGDRKNCNETFCKRKDDDNVIDIIYKSFLLEEIQKNIYPMVRNLLAYNQTNNGAERYW
ncbi:hypothetical protein ILUMI_03669 [Ignelater luminosus]|uniref:Mutator-like transposase domain-containing protein n=1 Tax=Ignelater luminosus TaxID=2038154 RepID=A0A8K0GJQ7_IGNLU|nr:hypothetical protein ILUMI_03669 [Ignelater luminosus]